jgi:TRAP-type uncharacterized transport system fused permease subunit
VIVEGIFSMKTAVNATLIGILIWFMSLLEPFGSDHGIAADSGEWELRQKIGGYPPPFH